MMFEGETMIEPAQVTLATDWLRRVDALAEIPEPVTESKLAWLAAQCERRAKGSEEDNAWGMADEWLTVAKWLRGLR